MLHRHLDSRQFTLAAIDDAISRGRWEDWVELRSAVLQDREMLDRVRRVCEIRIADPYAQRYHFWSNYAAAHRA
jgi:hypothetical protein